MALLTMKNTIIFLVLSLFMTLGGVGQNTCVKVIVPDSMINRCITTYSFPDSAIYILSEVLNAKPYLKEDKITVNPGGTDICYLKINLDGEILAKRVFFSDQYYTLEDVCLTSQFVYLFIRQEEKEETRKNEILRVVKIHRKSDQVISDTLIRIEKLISCSFLSLPGSAIGMIYEQFYGKFQDPNNYFKIMLKKYNSNQNAGSVEDKTIIVNKASYSLIKVLPFKDSMLNIYLVNGKDSLLEIRTDLTGEILAERFVHDIPDRLKEDGGYYYFGQTIYPYFMREDFRHSFLSGGAIDLSNMFNITYYLTDSAQIVIKKAVLLPDTVIDQLGGPLALMTQSGDFLIYAVAKKNETSRLGLWKLDASLNILWEKWYSFDNKVSISGCDIVESAESLLCFLRDENPSNVSSGRGYRLLLMTLDTNGNIQKTP